MTFSNPPWAGKQFDLPRSSSCLFLLPLTATTHSWYGFLEWSVLLSAVSTKGKTRHRRTLKGTRCRGGHTFHPDECCPEGPQGSHLISVASSVRGVDNSISAPSPRLSTTKSLEKMHISGAPGYNQALCPHTTKSEQLLCLHGKCKTWYNHSIKLLGSIS